MHPQKRWNRESPDPSIKQHLVAFLDILGFKNMLEAKEFKKIAELFDEIADTIYHHKRTSNLHAWQDVFLPKVFNFSDSFVIYQPLFEKEGRWSHHINSSIFDSFQFVVRDVVATSLRMGVPIRGVVTIGEFYAGEASSIVPEKVYRGPQAYAVHLVEDLGEPVPLPEDYDHKILDAIKLPIHFGQALIDAYVLENTINSIGVFMRESTIDRPFLKPLLELRIARKDFIKTKTNSGTLYAFNWCNRIDYENYLEIERFILSQIATSVGSIKLKWESLYEFTKTAPKK